MTRWTVKCNSCGQSYRLQALEPVVVVPLTIAHCPYCGGKAGAIHDTDRDYWEILAESLGPELQQDGLVAAATDVTPELLQELFAVWRSMQRGAYFTQFVRSVIDNPDTLSA